VLLLDTHALVWSLADSSRLSTRARKAINDGRRQGGGLFISGVSLFEVANLIVRKRLGMHVSLESFLEEIESHFTILPITRQIAARSVQLPNPYPKDPMDRIIGATALVEGFPLVTADENIHRARVVKTIW
jgi:PIN domain nuclease of toxin-antitoxin system